MAQTQPTPWVSGYGVVFWVSQAREKRRYGPLTQRVFAQNPANSRYSIGWPCSAHNNRISAPVASMGKLRKIS